MIKVGGCVSFKIKSKQTQYTLSYPAIGDKLITYDNISNTQRNHSIQKLNKKSIQHQIFNCNPMWSIIQTKRLKYKQLILHEIGISLESAPSPETTTTSTSRRTSSTPWWTPSTKTTTSTATTSTKTTTSTASTSTT